MSRDLMHPELATDDMLTARQAAALLGVPVRTFYGLPIARYAVGPRCIRWKRSDVLAFRESRRIEAPREPRAHAKAASIASPRGSELRQAFARALGVDHPGGARLTRRRSRRWGSNESAHN